MDAVAFDRSQSKRRDSLFGEYIQRVVEFSQIGRRLKAIRFEQVLVVEGGNKLAVSWNPNDRSGAEDPSLVVFAELGVIVIEDLVPSAFLEFVVQRGQQSLRGDKARSCISFVIFEDIGRLVGVEDQAAGLL